MKIDVSIGEIVDKVTILLIKLNKIKDAKKLKNIMNEYNLVKVSMEEAGILSKSIEFIELLSINEKLWDIEDKIRLKEKQKMFDSEFIELARSVYHFNDQRYEVKRKINLNHGSNLIEEKEYIDYSVQ